MRALPRFAGLRALVDGTRLALVAIARSPMRASLTVLGILIGVAAVVAVTALGSGARDDVSQQIQSLGSNLLIVFPQNAQASGARGLQGSGARLTDDDARAILDEAVSVASVAPMLRTRGQIVSGDRNWSTNLVGTSLAYFGARNWQTRGGVTWEAHDELLKTKVVVLGNTVATKLFGSDDPVGRVVRIGRYPYRVLGVLEAKGNAPFGGDQDDVVLMPIASFRSRVMRTPPKFAGVLMVSALTADSTDRAIAQVDSILRQRHHIAEGADPDFAIRSQKEFQAMQEGIWDTLTKVLMGIAAISLVVGGIGVMNIMLVSVTERTREIGIRMAIGARMRDIRMQFLVEAVALSLLGGLAGALIGVAATAALRSALEWHMTIDARWLSASIGLSALTGIAFGFFPARRAAALDPIEALRHE